MSSSRLIQFLRKRRVTFGFIFGFAFLIVCSPTSPVFFTIGIILALLGEALRLIASGYIVKTDELAVYGPYSYVRHPLYCGSFIMGLGVCLSVCSTEHVITSSVVLAVYLLLFVTWYLQVMRDEEKFLIEKYGDAYRTYQHHVPMLIPRLTPYQNNSDVHFRRDVFARNREYRGLLGLLFVIAVLVLKYI